MQDITRRGFIGSATGAIGVVALGKLENEARAAAAGQDQGLEAKPKGLRIGMLTAPFGDKALVDVLDFAQKAGITCLEVVADPGSKHIDPVTFDAAKADSVKQMLAGASWRSAAWLASATPASRAVPRRSRVTPGRWWTQRFRWAYPPFVCRPECRSRT